MVVWLEENKLNYKKNNFVFIGIKIGLIVNDLELHSISSSKTTNIAKYLTM